MILCSRSAPFILSLRELIEVMLGTFDRDTRQKLFEEIIQKHSLTAEERETLQVVLNTMSQEKHRQTRNCPLWSRPSVLFVICNHPPYLIFPKGP